MAKVLFFSPEFAARHKTNQARRKRFVLLNAKAAEEAQSVRVTQNKDEHPAQKRTPARAMEWFYL